MKLKTWVLLSLIFLSGFGEATSMAKARASSAYLALAKQLYDPLNMALLHTKGFRCSSKPINWDFKFANFYFPNGKRDRFYYNSGGYWAYFVVKNKQIHQVWEANVVSPKERSQSAKDFLGEYKNDTVLRELNLEKASVTHWCGKVPNNSGHYVRVDYNMGDWLIN